MYLKEAVYNIYNDQNYHFASSTAQGGGGSFKDRKPIGEVGCCESRMAEQIHWWTERVVGVVFFDMAAMVAVVPCGVVQL